MTFFLVEMNSSHTRSLALGFIVRMPHDVQRQKPASNLKKMGKRPVCPSFPRPVPAGRGSPDHPIPLCAEEGGTDEMFSDNLSKQVPWLFLTMRGFPPVPGLPLKGVRPGRCPARAS